MRFSEQNQPQAGDTVVVGMSGGVDSTVVAFLLQQRGCIVIGATMALWDGSLSACGPCTNQRETCYGPGEKEEIAACRFFCKEHGIAYHVVDVSACYQHEVLDYYKNEYRAGRTPNPCVRCNHLIKFGALRNSIDKLGIHYDFFCTGHYANVVRPLSPIWGSDQRPFMMACAADTLKDQSYFLYRLPSSVLEKVRFPLANMKKDQVVSLARKARLAAANKKESQDFIAPEYREALFADAPSTPGNFIDMSGRIIGRHHGIEHYTVGQRRGLGISSSVPLYVHSIDTTANTISLCPSEGLLCSGLIADDFVWPMDVQPDRPFQAQAMIRLSSGKIDVNVSRHQANPNESFRGTAYKIAFAQPQQAVAIGQSVVLYADDVIIGGGIIESSF